MRHYLDHDDARKNGVWGFVLLEKDTILPL
ncbi:MAG: hypothetical protein CM15mP47_2610 [Methanobacteriota archaeon]|nr:MAG: hypothetical protein CM15mP47_2610 [Euryarchaeota archaeon]